MFDHVRFGVSDYAAIKAFASRHEPRVVLASGGPPVA